ncbi:MAG: signal peptide peptidase SppA [Nitrospinae bacterium]|nr:signal peptide peptidase SppA [Nitrospinota bacterium]MBF0634786.1 signal peptide peptidase SppA [Nitrospinota bacterium]
MGSQRKTLFTALAVTLFFVFLWAVFAASFNMFFPSGGGIKESLSLSDGKVAIVRLHGVIMDGTQFMRQLDKWAEDDSVKAIVISISSPGGVVGPSQEIYSAVRKAAAKKPVVASMGAVAASGGYYVAAACNKIVANPGTITGSIGVIMMFSTSFDLMDKIGLKAVVVKSGKFKDTGSPARPFTEEDRALMQGVVDDTYDQFINDVAQGRGLSVDEVRKVADGRILTGRQAFKAKLVDKLGGFEDAVELAALLGGISGKPNRVEEEKKKSLMETILGDENEVSLPFRLKMPAGLYYMWPAW